jgi:hypothetical protein
VVIFHHHFGIFNYFQKSWGFLQKVQRGLPARLTIKGSTGKCNEKKQSLESIREAKDHSNTLLGDVFLSLAQIALLSVRRFFKEAEFWPKSLFS